MSASPDLHSYRGRIQDLDSHLQVAMRRYPELMGMSGELIYEQFMARAAGSTASGLSVGPRKCTRSLAPRRRASRAWAGAVLSPPMTTRWSFGI